MTYNFDPDLTGSALPPRQYLQQLLTDEWQSTEDLAEAVGLHVSDAYIHLTCLFVEHRADMQGASDDEDVPTLEEQMGQLWRRA